MRTTSSPNFTTKFHQPVQNFMNKLVSRDFKTLPRKLASTPFAASLLSPLPPEEALKRQMQLQRITDIVVLDATRDKKNQLLLTLKLSLKPEAPREPVGIFIPNNSSVAVEVTKTFHDVNQLGKLLTFCVEKSAEDCDFCSKLGEYLRTHWARDPLVTVVNMGDTVVRKASLAMHLARLVAVASGTSVDAPRVATVPTDKGMQAMQLVPQLSPLGQSIENKKTGNVVRCSAQNEVAAVLFDFFDVFSHTEKTTAVTETEL